MLSFLTPLAGVMDLSLSQSKNISSSNDIEYNVITHRNMLTTQPKGNPSKRISFWNAFGMIHQNLTFNFFPFVKFQLPLTCFLLNDSDARAPPVS